MGCQYATVISAGCKSGCKRGSPKASLVQGRRKDATDTQTQSEDSRTAKSYAKDKAGQGWFLLCRGFKMGPFQIRGGVKHDEEHWVPPNSAFTTTSMVSNYYLASFHPPAVAVTLSSWQPRGALMLL